MLSHLRFHRRGPSNPSSPIPDTGSPWDATPLQPTQLVSEDGVPAPEVLPRSTTSVPFTHGHGQPPPPPSQSVAPTAPLHQQHLHHQAPLLPPTARASSTDSDRSMDPGRYEPKQREEVRPLLRSSYNEESGFIGGLALENYRREQEARRPGPLDRTTVNKFDHLSFKSYSGSANAPHRPPSTARPAKPMSSFVAPGTLTNSVSAGRRPPGARTIAEPPTSQSQTAAQDPPRGRKSLPFLKNPMSTLLMRRKTSQNIPDLTLPLRGGAEEPPYDPRIKGTRVHDFSAPRPRRIVSSNEPISSRVEEPYLDIAPSAQGYKPPVVEAPPVPPKDENFQYTRTSSTHSRAVSVGAVSPQGPRDPDNPQPSHRHRGGGGNSPRRKTSVPPSLIPLSRDLSRASFRDVASSVPRHMKSTSSRFSFDMAGAAQQERLLEERHRQRQQDKKADESTGRRDSRFDDFEEDAFDYDAMDYDDGLEERIPGVNADLDEEDFGGADDPDNDQENFAGFIFQRSTPVSELTSPQSVGVFSTPKDANGNAAGYTTSHETLGISQFSHVAPGIPGEVMGELGEQLGSTGLGIQGLETVNEISKQLSTRQQQEVTTQRVLDKDDELYFNDGLIHDFVGEGDGSAFDESIFDLNDTDQYGRPIPGLFANVLSQRQTTEVTKRRESDITSRLSAQSDLSHSTAHTSLSAGPLSKPPTSEPEEGTIARLEERQPSASDIQAAERDRIAAYQAALAAAAHQAAASGKFRRDSSPPPPAELTIAPLTISGSSQLHAQAHELDDYEIGDGLSLGLEDYELDDDDIIAEANASALANDSDGWYGQEFGFYSAPAPAGHHNTSVLSEKNLYQYSHGGYFGPTGANGATLGRVVSREPNLTPITERSEYSNRNSIMSLGVPQSTNNNAPVQSPGLAQLVMMAEDDNMSLSALLRLRSKAWGGSQASLVSSRDGSPSDRNGTTSPWGQDQLGIAHGRKNSAFSIISQDSVGAGSGAGSPTLTMSMNAPNSIISPLPVSLNPNPRSTSPASAPVFSPLQPTAGCPPVFEDEETSPLDRRKTEVGGACTVASGTLSRPPGGGTSPMTGITSQKKPGMGHRHRGSADSISYSREEDSGETRWVMERRRTSESGEVEVLGREVVDRGRI
ncbi:hypothetical protein GGS23DRAFT_589658 [Durotheca rogersii]|uniref:uncharacterized protein n=1 Tax=Durotheca rogersii TaxID=419775 RepID=UPI00221E4202|nr:uncharacterized protein GGS23DRAFT_589658 [Durotheca rogersii]KAI5855558.1 hypothetical protein GGS23DRAFT_589658 [Durotheca rogersii]